MLWNIPIITNRDSFADVEDVKFVINFDYPSNSEDYVHRIGRTGRSDKTGTAYTFFTPNNQSKAADLVAVLKEAKQVINPKLQEMAENRNWGGGGAGRGKTRKSKYSSELGQIYGRFRKFSKATLF